MRSKHILPCRHLCLGLQQFCTMEGRGREPSQDSCVRQPRRGQPEMHAQLTRGLASQAAGFLLFYARKMKWNQLL